MRNVLLVAFVILPVAACANGVGGEALTGASDHHETRDGGAGVSATEEGGDIPYGDDAGSGDKDDAASLADDGGESPDAGGAYDSGAPDAGVATDSGTDTAPVDAGPPGESCTAPVDVSLGGTFTVDTCSVTNSVAASCGTTAAAVILRGDAPGTGSTYSITFPAGWVLVEVDSTCTPMPDSCGSTGTWGVSGANPYGYWYFAIEPADGTCATTTVTVDRVM
jgi:hypothetical protein